MKKIILSTGFAVAALAPIATVVSCSSSDSSSFETKKTFTIKKGTQDTFLKDQKSITDWFQEAKEKLEKEDKMVTSASLKVKSGTLLNDSTEVNSESEPITISQQDAFNKIKLKSDEVTIEIELKISIITWDEFENVKGGTLVKDIDGLKSWINKQLSVLQQNKNEEYKKVKISTENGELELVTNPASRATTITDKKSIELPITDYKVEIPADVRVAGEASTTATIKVEFTK